MFVSNNRYTLTFQKKQGPKKQFQNKFQKTGFTKFLFTAASLCQTKFHLFFSTQTACKKIKRDLQSETKYASLFIALLEMLFQGDFHFFIPAAAAAAAAPLNSGGAGTPSSDSKTAVEDSDSAGGLIKLTEGAISLDFSLIVPDLCS